jgi:hypothetical protein
MLTITRNQRILRDLQNVALLCRPVELFLDAFSGIQWRQRFSFLSKSLIFSVYHTYLERVIAHSSFVKTI